MKHSIAIFAALSLALTATIGCTKEEEKFDETMTLKGSVITIGGEGGEVSANLNTNVNFNVSIQSGVDWVKYIPATKAAAPENKALTFNVSAFPKSTEASRSAIVTISYTGLKDQILTIVQTPLVQTYLSVNPDNTRFTMEGGVMTVDVQSSVDYTVKISDEWITAEAGNPSKGNGTAKFNIAENKIKSDREATVTFETEGLDPIEIQVHQDAYSSNIGIKSLSDFLEFVQASNNGDYETHNLEKWVNEDGEICLLCDLDLSGITDWTPIGQATDLTLVKNRSALADSVRAFGNRYASGKGIFNGMNHVISGLKITVDDNKENNYRGFFGPIYNATIKNLVFDETCSITVSRTVPTSDAFGFVTPSAIASTIENVIVKGSINIKKTLDDGETYRGLYVGAITGVLCSNASGDAIVKDCSFNGKMNVVQEGWGTSNPKALGGIVGYAVHDLGTGDDRWADPDNKHITKIVGCTNSTTIEGTIRFMGGIVGSTFNNVTIEKCVNTGNIFDDSYQGAGRIGGIIGYDEGNSIVTGCENKGNIHSLDTKSTCLGGITSVIAGKGVYTDNKCDNIISGQYKTKGLFVANVNNASATFSGNLAKGSIAESYSKGEYSGKVDVNEDNFGQYVGSNGKNANTFSEGVKFWK